MTESANRLANEVLQLSARDRAEVAYLILRSLDHDQDADADAEWEAELTRRWNEFENGTAKALPFDEVMAALRAKYK